MVHSERIGSRILVPRNALKPTRKVDPNVLTLLTSLVPSNVLGRIPGPEGGVRYGGTYAGVREGRAERCRGVKRSCKSEGLLTCTGHPQMVCMAGRVGRKDHSRLDKAIENIDSFGRAQRCFQKPGEVARVLIARLLIR